ncbi:MAG: leucine-rich repeat domain-containing protein [Kiritimatiellae bacterium]|nr:leucine-rich repeat domain-containing protein [Kiritimatiellia bacterium]
MGVARQEKRWFAPGRAIPVAAAALFCAVVGLDAVAGTDCWTYTPPPSGKTQGTLSWTDSSGFENVVNGIKIVSGTDKKLYIYESTNGNNSNARNLDFSVGIEDDYELVDIQRSAFNGNSTVTNFVAPPSLVTLGRYAFNSCSALVHVEFNDGLETIGEHAFDTCSALSTIDNFLPSSVKFIDKNAFYKCTAITTDCVAAGVTNIASRAFEFASVPSFDFSAAPLDMIDELAFYEMPALTNVVLNQTLRSIGREAFRGCTALKTVSPLLPTGLRVFGSGNSGVFYGCTALEGDVLWPNSLTNIANRAFYQSKITTFTARGKDIVRFETHPLFSCTALTNIILSSSIATYGSALMDSCKGGSLERHVWFLGPPPAAFPNQFFSNTDRLYVTLHLPWSQQEAWREYAATASNATFTFNKATKTLPEHLDDVGTWQSGVTQNVTWWKDRDPHFTIKVR